MNGGTTPLLRTWQFFHAFRNVLGDAYLQKLYKKSLRQLQRWSADPAFTESSQQNPIDRIEHILTRLCEIGREDLARAVVMRFARIVGFKTIPSEEEIIPDKADWRDEILDDLPALAKFHEACQGYIQGKEWAETVVHWCDEAIKEIKETKIKVLSFRKGD